MNSCHLKQHKVESNPSVKFIYDTFEITGQKGDRISNVEMRELYTTWCVIEGEKEATVTKFNKYIKSLHNVKSGVTSRIDGNLVKCYSGLELKDKQKQLSTPITIVDEQISAI